MACFYLGKGWTPCTATCGKDEQQHLVKKDCSEGDCVLVEDGIIYDSKTCELPDCFGEYKQEALNPEF